LSGGSAWRRPTKDDADLPDAPPARYFIVAKLYGEIGFDHRFMNLVRAVGIVLLFAGTACAADQKSSVEVLNRGQQISTAVAAVTSTAISPLLGVCLLGIYDYARASDVDRSKLPFYSRPHFWIPISVLLLLIFFKDSIGHTVPWLKKPLDAIEVLVVNKAALVLIVFPVMYHQVSRLTGIQDISELIQPVVYAATPTILETAGHWGAAGLMLVAGTIIVLVVWVVGHAADVLALLSPVPFLDVVVKGSRVAVMLAVAGCAILSPTLGLIASGIVIGVCALLFWMALRVLILGWVFGWDLLLWRKNTAVNGGVRAFTIGKIQGMPWSALGKLSRDPNGILEFRYRRLGFGPSKRVRLEDASAYSVGRGILYPCVVLSEARQFRLLPRYRGSEEGVRAALGMGSVRDLGLGKLWWGSNPRPRGTGL
jgi:hypothetical protein